MKSIFKKSILLLSVLYMLLSLCLYVAGAEESVQPKHAIGGVCTVDGKMYMTDRYQRALYTIENGVPVLLIGQTTQTDAYGRPVTGYRDGQFSAASFGEPCGIVPFRGGLLIADRENNVLRYADLQKKQIYTFAGSGKAEFRDGTDSAAAFSAPTDLILGENNTVYVSDTRNHAIRCVSESGMVTTYIGGTEGTALGSYDEAALSYPTGLCYSDHILYIADTGNHRILSVQNGTVSLLAGAVLTGDTAIEGDLLNGSAKIARFASPSDVIAHNGTVYVADTGNAVVRVIHDGYVTTLEHDTLSVPLYSPDVLFTVENTHYVSDSAMRVCHPLPDAMPEATYSDTASSPFTEAIRFVTVNGLMMGTGDGYFSPELPVTRGMFLTVLARYDGMNTAVGTQWWEIGVQWGMDNGVSDGTHPENPITQEQLLTMLYRYVGEPEITSDHSFSDVADYAMDAAAWAIHTGIITEDDLRISGDPVTREQTAKLLFTFLQYA